MARIRSLPVGLLVGALLLAACTPASPVAPSTLPTAPATLVSTAAAAGQQQYTNSDFGFSLSYPAGFEVQESSPNTVLFLAPQGTPGHRERAWITSEFTSEQTAEWYATRSMEDNANLGTQITSSVQVLDGQQAYILGQLPGQDLNRQVFVVNNGILYHLTFVPDDPATGENYQQMEALYAAILPSLRFWPEHRAMPPLTDLTNMIHELERVLNARSVEGIARLLGDEFVLGSLDSTTAEAFHYTPYAAADAVPLILSDHISPKPSLDLIYQVDWSTVPGSLDNYSGIFPGEVVTPILAKGWGPNGDGAAVLILASRPDGSLFWRGAFDLQGLSLP